MKQHCNGAIPDVVIDRVFSGAVMRNPPPLSLKMNARGPFKTPQTETIGKVSTFEIRNSSLGFEDFVAFLLAEEDKKHPTSIEYWFRQAVVRILSNEAFQSYGFGWRWSVEFVRNGILLPGD